MTPNDNYSIETDLCGVIFSSVSLVLSMVFIITTFKALSQAGDLIATGDRDGRVKITKFPMNFEIDSFCIGHKGAITDLMFSKKHLFSGSSVKIKQDGFVKVWSLETSEYVDELDISTLIDMPKPHVQEMHHHCRDRRIVVVLKNLSKVVWFDYDKRGKIEKKFFCDLPLITSVISSCWDFHGLFWVGARDRSSPISMFFIDLEMAKVFDVDVLQDHRYKALKKHLFRKTNALQYQNHLTSHKQLFIDRILPSSYIML
ncbi:LOW QUALITY PROTEIN: hypothetical protein MXB_2286 [Myxobolus squamalis]|nr:LOW QUALITY PROTEIN: hypothetical protein MXB_2286 [Myxobolus squamalis]